MAGTERRCVTRHPRKRSNNAAARVAVVVALFAWACVLPLAAEGVALRAWLDELDAAECVETCEFDAERQERVCSSGCAFLSEPMPENPFDDPGSVPGVEMIEHGYDVELLRETRDCYVRVLLRSNESDSGQLEYSLETLPKGWKVNDTDPELYITHLGPCSGCSDLQSLAVYLDTKDFLQDESQDCAQSTFFRQVLLGWWPQSTWITNKGRDCFQNIGAYGFKGMCRDTWFWNAFQTSQSCAQVCLGYLNQPANQPVKLEECRFLEFGCKAKRALDKDFCATCQNRINGEPVCSEHQFEEGPFRLNPCIQCDECASGPMFMKLAGRTRRNTGIASSILRPGEKGISIASYGFDVDGLSDLE